MKTTGNSVLLTRILAFCRLASRVITGCPQLCISELSPGTTSSGNMGQESPPEMPQERGPETPRASSAILVGHCRSQWPVPPTPSSKGPEPTAHTALALPLSPQASECVLLCPQMNRGQLCLLISGPVGLSLPPTPPLQPCRLLYRKPRVGTMKMLMEPTWRRGSHKEMAS